MNFSTAIRIVCFIGLYATIVALLFILASPVHYSDRPLFYATHPSTERVPDERGFLRYREMTYREYWESVLLLRVQNTFNFSSALAHEIAAVSFEQSANDLSAVYDHIMFTVACMLTALLVISTYFLCQTVHSRMETDKRKLALSMIFIGLLLAAVLPCITLATGIEIRAAGAQARAELYPMRRALSVDAESVTELGGAQFVRVTNGDLFATKVRLMLDLAERVNTYCVLSLVMPIVAVAVPSALMYIGALILVMVKDEHETAASPQAHASTETCVSRCEGDGGESRGHRDLKGDPLCEAELLLPHVKLT